MKISPRKTDTSKDGCHIMVLAGEPSGDVHGAALIQELFKNHDRIRVSGMGGPLMAAAGADLFYPIENLSAMGLTEVVLQFRYIKQAFDRFRARLRQDRPDILVLIDYPGFNLRAAGYAKTRHHIKVLYYITPKVWAWNQGRLKKIKAFVDHAALIFPFEQKLYKKAGIPATYVGNPLMDRIKPGLTGKRDSLGGNCSGKTLTIGLLPGSRKNEISRLLMPLLEAGRLIHEREQGVRFLVSCADSISPELVHGPVSDFNGQNLFQVVQGHPESIFQRADLVIAASGTVTLEAALYRVPTLIVYKMAGISYRLARILVKVRYAGLANIITGTEVMPELLQDEATPLNISQKALSMLKNLPRYRNRLTGVSKLLGPPGASRRAARLALGLIQEP